MRFKFTPKNLMASRKEIAEVHPFDNEVEINFYDEELRDLIIRFVEMDSSKVKMYANTLSKHEVMQIVGYIPYNNYQVELDNLFKVYQVRNSIDNAQIFFKNWQDSFENEDCNKFLASLTLSDGFIQQVLKDNNLIPMNFANNLSKGQILSYFMDQIKSEQESSDESLESIASNLGVNESSKLFYKIKFLYYTICNKDEYLNCDSETLFEIVKKYANSSREDLLAFIRNFVSKLSLRELEKFSQIARYLSQRIGEKGTKSFENFFKNDPILSKYNNWINIILINDIFGNDDRSLFWKQYKFENVVRYRANNSVVLKMNDFSVIEFLGKGMGASYFCNHEIYKDKIANYLYKNNIELKTKLNEAAKHYEDTKCSNGKPAMFRLEHRGDWQFVFNSLLLKYKMTEQI